ncbi:transposase [Xanthomonas arboricola]|uniref:transposase n=1 Tax=Xanthomonas arboricola TaxID=56448 RepID=UPI001EE13DDB|nr:transposase [Xanthomonas arboricola]
MDNHVHLLVSADKAGAVSSAMRLSGQSYVQAFNVRHRCSETLWQGGSSPAWCRPNHICSRSCATSNSIRLHPMQERALGDSGFQVMVKRALGWPMTCRPRGRPAGGTEVG